MRVEDCAEAEDLIAGALLVFRGELANIRRGAAYRIPWIERAERWLIRSGRCLPAKVLPFPEYTPDAPGGSH